MTGLILSVNEHCVCRVSTLINEVCFLSDELKLKKKTKPKLTPKSPTQLSERCHFCIPRGSVT